MSDSEAEIYWYKFIDGDKEALSVLFLHYAKGLVSYGMKIFRDEEIIKDSIQEIFIQLIQNRHKLNRNEKIGGLVYKLLRNKIIDEIRLLNRTKKNDNLFSKFNNSVEIDAEQQQIGFEEENDRDRMINPALNRLSVHQKEVLFLKYSNGLNYDQIALVMGISVASTRTMIYRTLKQLKSHLLENRVTNTSLI